MHRQIEILDSTLRDGAQGEGISFTVRDKLQIARALDEFGIDIIEAGYPGSNPKDAQFFREARALTLKHARLCAFGRTRRKSISAEDDDSLRALIAAETPVVAVFGKAWGLHAREILGVSAAENLRIIADTIRYIKANDREAIFDAEHFFDGYNGEPEYALATLATALDNGADTLVLCDTNGGAMPFEIAEAVSAVVARFPQAKIGIHCHNDAGCAAANAIIAVERGAAHVQGTLIGAGERCGNADLSVILPNLILKLGYAANVDLAALSHTAVRVAEISNVALSGRAPYVGGSAFAHKAGMHIDAALKLTRAYEHIDPAAVGNSRRILASEISGKAAIAEKVKIFAPNITKDDSAIAEIADELKARESEGYQYEAADASFELLAKRKLGLYSPHFKLIFYRATVESFSPDAASPCSAIVRVEVDGADETSAAMGNGPVNALDGALRRALSGFYPQLAQTRLTDFKVRVLETNRATSARVRVLIESTDGETSWTTVGVSADIIEASWRALVDGVEYWLGRGGVK